jgi:NitT/TauT family transport system substrate-binding protein
VASAQTIESKRPLIQKFIRAYLRGTDDYDVTFLQRDDEGTVLPGENYGNDLTMIAERTGLTLSLVQRALPYCDRLGRLDAQDVKRQIAFWQAQGLVDRQIASADLFDFSFAGAIDP